jgi:hypothetical protein
VRAYVWQPAAVAGFVKQTAALCLRLDSSCEAHNAVPFKKNPEPNQYIKIEMFCCNMACLKCCIDVCRRHNLIKRVPLLATKKWRDWPVLADLGPLLCLRFIIVFVSIRAWHVQQLLVYDRVYVVHV